MINKMKKIIVTGATSMLGLALIDECIKNNVYVLAIIREKSGRRNKIPNNKNIKIIECNLSDYEKIIIDDSFDTLFHFAWEGTNKKDRNDPIIQERNIKYALDAVKLAKRLGCKRFIGIGSQAEYGVKNEKLKSCLSTNPITSYGIAKLCACNLTNLLCNELKMDYIWVRVLSVYGKNDNKETLISSAIESMLKNESMKLTKGLQKWDYLYSCDAGEALFLIGIKGINGKIYNLGSGKIDTIYNYLVTIKKITNSKSKLKFGLIPINKNQPTYLCADISELVNDTSWKPKTSFSDGIRMMIGK